MARVYGGSTGSSFNSSWTAGFVLPTAWRRKGIDAIAEMLVRSAKTTSTHKMRLMQKFGIENDAELICYAIKHGLISGRDRS